MIRVVLTDVRCFENRELYERGFSLVRQERRDRAGRFKHQKDRCRSLAAGLLLRRGMLEAGLPYGELAFAEGEHGKPQVTFGGRPFHFNLTHAGDYAAAAFAPCPVGIDLESAGRIRSPRRLLGRILTQEERAILGEVSQCLTERSVHGEESQCPAEGAVHGEVAQYLAEWVVHGKVSQCPAEGSASVARSGGFIGTVSGLGRSTAGRPCAGAKVCEAMGGQPRPDEEYTPDITGGVPDALLRELLACVWTRKEAYVKATGEGLFADFREVGTFEPSAAARIESAEVIDHYWLSVCALDPAERISSLAILSGESLCTTN